MVRESVWVITHICFGFVFVFCVLVRNSVWAFYTYLLGFGLMFGDTVFRLSCCSLRFEFTGDSAWLLRDSFLSHNSVINWSHMLRSFAAGAHIFSGASFNIVGMIVSIDSAKWSR
jgi:hypothetical protein